MFYHPIYLGSSSTMHLIFKFIFTTTQKNNFWIVRKSFSKMSVKQHIRIGSQSA